MASMPAHAVALEDGAIVKEYEALCAAEGEKPVVAVTNSLQTCCAEKEKQKIWIEARGSAAEAFTNRMKDSHVAVLTKLLQPSVQFLTSIITSPTPDAQHWQPA
ncbi:unnamed protein product [Amoebophrya sp. A25]|nr:unnamed protein product [Amoebophrya sp. A25]|eukprot:GSA25T00023051001.1